MTLRTGEVTDKQFFAYFKTISYFTQVSRTGHVMEWNERKISVWKMELLKYGMKWKKISILARFNIVIILNAVNKAAFNQTHIKIKKKSSSQTSIQKNRLGKKNGNYNQISDISALALNSLQLQYRASFKVKSVCLVRLRGVFLIGNAETDNLLGCHVAVFAV